MILDQIPLQMPWTSPWYQNNEIKIQRLPTQQKATHTWFLPTSYRHMASIVIPYDSHFRGVVISQRTRVFINLAVKYHIINAIELKLYRSIRSTATFQVSNRSENSDPPCNDFSVRELKWQNVLAFSEIALDRIIIFCNMGESTEVWH